MSEFVLHPNALKDLEEICTKNRGRFRLSLVYWFIYAGS
jgi:hypothetical protein